jgi:hypothetical protein
VNEENRWTCRTCGAPRGGAEESPCSACSPRHEQGLSDARRSDPVPDGAPSGPERSRAEAWTMWIDEHLDMESLCALPSVAVIA